jgi:outer membrane biogenesis lipoprotein LolB
MKKFTFITAIAVAFVLTSCTADSEDITYSKSEQVQQVQQVQQFDSFDVYAKDGDSIVQGDPIKPKTRD